MDEKEAIGLLLKKDLEGLTWLMEQYQVRALRAAVLVTQDRALAEDVVQTKFVELFRRVQSYDPGRPFAPWFLRGVVNAAISAMQIETRISGFGDEMKEFEDLIDAAPQPETRAMQSEFAQKVQRSLLKLSPEQRGAVVMRYYLEMSEIEIAEASRVPKGTIKWRLHAARERLRKFLSVPTDKED
jgi:RNA polymerase sigma-70 factor (ECF subfamily)